MIKPGDIVRLNFPGHAGNNRNVTVVKIDPEFNIAPDDAPPCLSEVIFVKHENWPDAIGVGRYLIGVTEDGIIPNPRDKKRAPAGERDKEATPDLQGVLL